MNRGQSTRRPWTSADRRMLRNLYPHKPTASVAAELHRTATSVSAMAAILGVRKSAAYLASPAACRLRKGDNVGAACRFQPGHVPANKGLRRPGYVRGRMAETQFRKGQKPHTWVPVGTESLDSEGYRKRKVSDNRKLASRFNWRFVHVMVWEEKHGRVPRDHAVVFKNGDRSDIRLRNLELVPRRELMLRNSVHRLPREIAQVIQLRGALIRQIHRGSA